VEHRGVDALGHHLVFTGQHAGQHVARRARQGDAQVGLGERAVDERPHERHAGERRRAVERDRPHPRGMAERRQGGRGGERLMQVRHAKAAEPEGDLQARRGIDGAAQPPSGALGALAERP
jgi:hypothetical protein